MNYDQCIEWLFNYTLVDQFYGKKAYSPGIYSIKKLCKYLGNPQNYFQSIHIAGTNGKGSTCHMLASILQESGYKIGLFTSPHFNHFYERIQYNGNYIEKKFITEFIKNHKNYFKKNKYSFFEITTSLAFLYFKYKNVDIAIIETGIGGKLDATNIIFPMMSIITHIGIDHIDILGNTINKIAAEKAGIIKYNTPVIIGPNVSGTENIFYLYAKKQNAKIFFTKKKENKFLYTTPLLGIYQICNQKTVLTSINVLKELNIKISENNIKNGFNNILINTHFKGRWHYLYNKDPKIVCDIAHNEDGMKFISYQIQRESYKKLHLILGFVKGRNIIKLLSFFPKKANYYFCEPQIPRKVAINDIKKITKNYKYAKYFHSVKLAFLYAKKQADKDDFIFLGGSTFVVSEII